ncbi:MAG: alpha/beta hydrolase [Caldilinea sp.]
MATFVLCHGGWAGGWQWHSIPSLLRSHGHVVFTPTYTGMGERIHLAHPEIDLDTHITDIENVIKFEQLRDVILVGYSYSGMVITGVANRIPAQITHLVYLDAFVPEDGQSLADLLGAEIVGQIMQVVEQVGQGWKVPHIPDPGKPGDPRLMLHPLKCALQPVILQNPAALSLPRSFIFCTEDKDTMLMGRPIVQAAQMAKASAHWHYYELHTDHNPIENTPEELSSVLIKIALQR